jgi:hypothetical protein
MTILDDFNAVEARIAASFGVNSYVRYHVAGGQDSTKPRKADGIFVEETGGKRLVLEALQSIPSIGTYIRVYREDPPKILFTSRYRDKTTITDQAYSLFERTAQKFGCSDLCKLKEEISDIATEFGPAMCISYYPLPPPLDTSNTNSQACQM